MTYSESYFATRETWRDWRIEARTLSACARVTRGARVLEIGCGGGGLLRMLRARGARAVGVDTWPVALALARERLGTDAEQNVTASPCHSVTLSQISEDGALPFRTAAFDALVAQHVVEHLVDVDAALREWARVVKPGGRLALATPNARYPDPAHFADANHAHIFSPRELCAAVTRAGFVVVSCRTLFPFLSHHRALRALGVMAHAVFARLPYFALRGRTILLDAVRRSDE